MARVEITDEESVRAWLEEQPHQVRVWFAARCIMRMLPRFGALPPTAIPLAAYPTFRALLISTAAVANPAAPIKDLSQALNAASGAADTGARGAAGVRASAHGKAARGDADTAGATASADLFAIAYGAESSVECAVRVFANHTLALSFMDDILAAAAAAAASADAEHPGEWRELWPGGTMPTGLAQLWPGMKQYLRAESDVWGFWLDWYEAILEGRPLPWDLSLRIATDVTEAEWNAGPEVVASRIAEIRARYELEQRISDLEQERDRYRAQASRLGIGGNNPPEPLEDIAALRRETAIIWAAIDDLKAETAAPTPDKARIGQIIDVLSHGLVAIARWCGGKGDLAVDTLIKWSIPFGAGTLLARPELLEAVTGAARQWLHLIP